MTTLRTEVFVYPNFLPTSTIISITRSVTIVTHFFKQTTLTVSTRELEIKSCCGKEPIIISDHLVNYDESLSLQMIILQINESLHNVNRGGQSLETFWNQCLIQDFNSRHPRHHFVRKKSFRFFMFQIILDTNTSFRGISFSLEHLLLSINVYCSFTFE